MNKDAKGKKGFLINGTTMIEYALIAALIAVVAVAALTGLGTKVTAKFTAVSAAMP